MPEVTLLPKSIIHKEDSTKYQIYPAFVSVFNMNATWWRMMQQDLDPKFRAEASKSVYNIQQNRIGVQCAVQALEKVSYMIQSKMTRSGV